MFLVLMERLHCDKTNYITAYRKDFLNTKLKEIFPVNIFGKLKTAQSPTKQKRTRTICQEFVMDPWVQCKFNQLVLTWIDWSGQLKVI